MIAWYDCTLGLSKATYFIVCLISCFWAFLMAAPGAFLAAASVISLGRSLGSTAFTLTPLAKASWRAWSGLGCLPPSLLGGVFGSWSPRTPACAATNRAAS